MKVNCGFNRRVPGKGKKRIEHENVQKIDIGDLDWDSDREKIREVLMKHKPAGEGWMITGYAPVERYAIGLRCEITRRLISVSLTYIGFDIGLAFTSFDSIEQAEEFIERWRNITTWNWDGYVVVGVDEKDNSHLIEEDAP